MVAMVAVFAISALAASVASAATPPEFKPWCYKKGPGSKYASKAKCEKSEASTGEWERIHFTSTSGAALLETTAGDKVECTSDTDEGELTGSKADTVTVHFKGCKAFGAPCQSGAVAEEIVTKPMVSLLGFIKKATEVGIALSPETGTALAEFECAGVPILVKGSVIGKITPLKTKTTIFTLTFTQTGGVQSPTKLEGEPEDVLFTRIGAATEPFVQSGEATVATLTMSEETEVTS
jgi:hypothetical protein